MDDSKWPRWRFHKEKRPEGKVIYSSAENEALGEGWVDSPTQFESDSAKPLEPEAPAEPAKDVQPSPAADDVKAELDLEDLRNLLVKRGLKRAQLKGKSKEELQRMLEV